MRKILFSLFLLLFFFSSSASAFEDTVERYPSGSWTDYWDFYSNSRNSYVSTRFNNEYNTNALFLSFVCEYSNTQTWRLTTKDCVENPAYFSFVTRESYWGGSIDINYIDQATGTSIITGTIPSIKSYTKYELVWDTSNLRIYENGVLISTKPGGIRQNVLIQFYRKAGLPNYGVRIDDITTGSCIGIPEIITESNADIQFTWSAQLMRSYTEPYKISLYSLTNPNNTGIVKTWETGNNPEFGKITDSRIDVLGNNFGLYMLEMSRGSDVLTDQYFYYDQLSNPQGFPEILFLGESSVKTEIRDEDHNGGEIAGGGSVYLYPKIKENGTYNFTYNILESPYKIKTELTTVYNNTPIDSTTINFSGLSNQNYKISVDGADAGSTDGADTFSHTFTDWGSEKNHIISFAPDYTLAGVWGEVKNSETQTGIKSATVSVSGENFSKTLYTDDNGLFYLTKGMQPGKTYTISVSKTGYSTPPSQTAITVDGTTTRQDFYIDKLSTSGSGMYYAPHDVSFTVLEYWYSGAGITGVKYAIYNGTESIKTGTTDSKGMFTGSDMSGGTNYTIILTHNGKTYTEYIEPSLSEYTFVLNKEGILHQYANPWLTLSYIENSKNVTIAYESNKTITGASLTAIAGNGTIVYTQTLSTATGSFTFETGGEGDYTLNFHIQATDGSTASQSWGLSYPNKVPLFPDSYSPWLKNILFSGIVIVFLLSFGKSKNDIACGAVAVLTSMGYIFGWFSGSYYFVVLVWIIALGAAFLHYKRTGGIG